MKIVIKIPEEIYDFVQNTSFVEDERTLSKQTNAERQKTLFLFDIIDAIRNGTPLPEHHGRLIDEQSIIDRFKPVEKYRYWRIGLDGLFNVLSDAPTIIEGSDSGMTNEFAIKALTELRGYGDKFANIGFDRKEALDMAIKALEQTRWIPVSERLPEDEQEILFSTKTGRVQIGKYHDDDSANQWYSYRDKCRAWNNVVTAWMPLPQPYKAESEDKK